MSLDSPLPGQLSIGAGTALLACGTCFAAEADLRSLSVIVDAVEQPIGAFGMPRLDCFRALHPRLDPYDTRDLRSDEGSPDDPFLRSYRSGFWGIVRIAAAPRRNDVELVLRAELEGGARRTKSLARIPIAAPVQRVVLTDGHGARPLIAICMATFDPPLDLFRRQVESIRAQTHTDWVCVVSDDCSRPEAFSSIKDVVGGDPRFFVSRSQQRRGFYLNFERALAMAPDEAEYIALADQDDFWYPEKLAVLLEQIKDAQLVYSDARIIGRRGELISGTYWRRRSNNHTDLLSLLVANAVTGAASLFRREVLECALPFPPAQFAHYHDHWIALTALALGTIAFVDHPLYDYVQHRQATLGHAAANRITRLGDRLATLRRDPRERVRVSRTRYFVDVLRLTAFATILQMRCGEQMSPRKRQALDRFLRLERSGPALLRLGWRAARELAGAPETLGAEWALFQALAWRRMLPASARDRPSRLLRVDARPPADLAPGPNRRLPAAAGARAVAEKIAPLDLAISDGAPRRVNILIPTIDVEHFYGGYIAKFNLARRLAERGVRVRIVTVDPVGPLPRSWRTTIQSYSGLARVFDDVELAFARGSGRLEVSRNDGFIATTWWTAHIADSAREALGGAGFVYLIQEHEPFTFPMGTYAALASGSYRLPHFALFSSELLRGYFERHRIGVYDGEKEAGDVASIAFENAITAIRAPSAGELAARATRRLLFYARPEAHASRNMFEFGVLALQQALEEGAFRNGWELHGIGTVRRSSRIGLGGDLELELLPRSGQGDYASLLREHDVGLALMYTPHPSIVPIEMASAGLLTVTNTFENKTKEALSAISSNLIAGEPTIQGVAAALREASAGAEDFDRRARGSLVNWSCDWDRSFSDQLLGRLSSFLRRLDWRP